MSKSCSRAAGRKRGVQRRRGTAAVEFAVVFPVFMLFFLGLWEYSRIEMLRQTAAVAAFEAARLGTVAGADEPQVRNEATRILRRASVQRPNIVVQLTDVDAAVSISIPLPGNLWLSPLFVPDGNITSTYTLERDIVL